MIVYWVKVVVLGVVVAVWLPGTAVASETWTLGIGSSGAFSDVGSVHGYGIEQVAKLGIDTGCGESRFCPDDPISRAEMAAWLYRAAAHVNDAHPPPPAE